MTEIGKVTGPRFGYTDKTIFCIHTHAAVYCILYTLYMEICGQGSYWLLPPWTGWKGSFWLDGREPCLGINFLSMLHTACAECFVDKVEESWLSKLQDSGAEAPESWLQDLMLATWVTDIDLHWWGCCYSHYIFWGRGWTLIRLCTVLIGSPVQFFHQNYKSFHSEWLSI